LSRGAAAVDVAAADADRLRVPADAEPQAVLVQRKAPVSLSLMTGTRKREDDLQHETLIALPVGRMNELEDAEGVALERDGVGGKKLGGFAVGRTTPSQFLVRDKHDKS
jgi:hypothetical protein